MFQIPDGAYVEVKYPNSTVIVACRYMDEYHLRFGVKFTISANWQNVWNDARQRVLRSRRLRKMSVPGSWVIRAIYMYRYQKMAMITSYTIPIFQSGMAGQVDTDGTMNEAKRMILEMYEMDTQTHERISTDELENSVEEKGETYE